MKISEFNIDFYKNAENCCRLICLLDLPGLIDIDIIDLVFSQRKFCNDDCFEVKKIFDIEESSKRLILVEFSHQKVVQNVLNAREISIDGTIFKPCQFSLSLFDEFTASYSENSQIHQIDSEKYPFNLISRCPKLFDSLRKHVNTQLNADLVAKSGQYEIKLKTSINWSDKVKVCLQEFVTMNFSEKNYLRSSLDNDAWNTLIENAKGSCKFTELLEIDASEVLLELKGAKSSVEMVDKKVHLELEMALHRLSLTKNYLKNDLSPMLCKLLKLEAFATWCMLNIDTKLKITISSDEVRITGQSSSVEKAKFKLDEIIDKFVEQGLEIDAYLVEFLNECDDYVSKILLKNNIKCTIACSPSDSRKILIRAFDISTVEKCIQLIEKEFSVYAYELTDAAIEHIAGNKFTNFLSKKESDLHLSCKNRKIIRIKPDEKIIVCAGEKSLIHRLSKEINHFFEINILYSKNYMEEYDFTSIEMSYFKLVKYKEIMDFSGVVNDALNIKDSCIIQAENELTIIKVTANSHYHEKVYEFLVKLLRSKIENKFKLGELEMNVLTEPKQKMQIEYIASTEKCVITPEFTNASIDQSNKILMNRKFTAYYSTLSAQVLAPIDVKLTVVEAYLDDANTQSDPIIAFINNKCQGISNFSKNLTKNCDLKRIKTHEGSAFEAKDDSKSTIIYAVLASPHSDSLKFSYYLNTSVYASLQLCDANDFERVIISSVDVNHDTSSCLLDTVLQYFSEVAFTVIKEVCFIGGVQTRSIIKQITTKSEDSEGELFINESDNVLFRDISNDMPSSTKASNELKLYSFLLVSDSQLKIDNVKIGLEQIATNEVKTEVFEHKILMELSEAERMFIEQFCEKGCVRLRWENPLVKISLTGRMTNVLKSIRNVTNIIISHETRNKERASAELIAHKVQWEYEEIFNGSSKWIPYSVLMNNQIEEAYSMGRKRIVLLDADNIECTIDIEKNIHFQKNSHELNQGRIRRIDMEKSMSKFRLPDHWEKGQNTNIITLPPESDEFKTVLNKIIASGFAIGIGQVVSIQRIQNKRLLLQYESHKEGFIEKYGGNTNELTLYHGTCEASTHKIWSNGFNRSYAGKNGSSLGRGVYFAKNAQTSSGYTGKRYNSLGYIFVSKVLPGLCENGSSNINIPTNGDTTVDNTANPNVFVIYHDAQAYPEYLFTYK